MVEKEHTSESQGWRNKLYKQVNRELELHEVLHGEAVHFPEMYKYAITDAVIAMEKIKTKEDALRMAEQIDCFTEPYIRYPEGSKEKFTAMFDEAYNKYGLSPNRARWALKGVKEKIGMDLLTNKLAESMRHEAEGNASIDKAALTFAGITFKTLFRTPKPIIEIKPRGDFL